MVIRTLCSFALIVAACGDDESSDADTGPSADTALGDTLEDAATDVEATSEVVAPVPLPALQGTTPEDGAKSVPSSAWLVLTFAAEVSPAMLGGFALRCDADPIALGFDALGGGSIVVNPVGLLPASGACALTWPGPDGEASLAFTVAPEGEPAVVLYDREDLSLVAPFPDDTWLVADAEKPTGRRVAFPDIDRPDDVKAILGNISVVPQTLDGWSPLAPLVVELPATVDRGTIPTTEAESVDPFASIGLFDVDPASPTYLERHAFDIYLKEEPSAGNVPAHVWVIFPTAPLRPRGRYALVVTRRALVSASRPLAAAPYMERMLADATSPAGEALALLAAVTPAVRADDVALLLSISVRSIDDVPNDLLAIRAAVQAAPPPAFEVTEVKPDLTPGSAVRAIVTGVWHPPSWRAGNYFARDEAGKPKLTGEDDVPFVLALPDAALDGPVPLIIYGHGNPGSAEREVPAEANSGLAEAGFAVIGFTKIGNREFIMGSGDPGRETGVIFADVLTNKRFPELIAALDIAELLSFIRMIPTLEAIDVLPLEAPDGVPDIAVDAPLGYVGISHGALVGSGLLGYAPELTVAALVVGGGRWSTTTVHQESSGPFASHLYEIVTGVFPNLTRAEFWCGIALSQMNVDDQDWGMHARFTYRDKHALGTEQRASLLLVEGLEDVLVPRSSTRCAAASFGIPQVDPIAESVPFLDHIAAPVQANIDATTTAAFLQYVPPDVPGIAMSPGCENLDEGHSCAQANAAARALRAAFFKSAQAGVPVIDPAAIVAP